MKMQSHKVHNVCVVACPYCGHCCEDDLELLDLESQHALRCEACRQPFVAVLRECHACGEESLFVWDGAPPVAVLAALSCEWCGRGFAEVEEGDDHAYPGQ
jgi:hypothetical protein